MSLISYLSDSDDDFPIAGPSAYHSAPHSGVDPSLLDEALDFDTSLLIASLARRDLEDAIEVAEGKGKRRSDAPPSDAELAFRLQAEELERFENLTVDSRYAHTTTTDDHFDDIDDSLNEQAQLEAFQIMEKAAEDDRRAAEMLQRGLPLPPLTENQRKMEDPAFQRLLGFDVDPPSSAPLLQPKLAASRPTFLPPGARSVIRDSDGARGKNRPRTAAEEGFVDELDDIYAPLQPDVSLHPSPPTPTPTRRIVQPLTGRSTSRPSFKRATEGVGRETDWDPEEEEAFLKQISNFASRRDTTSHSSQTQSSGTNRTRAVATSEPSGSALGPAGKTQAECIVCMEDFPKSRTLQTACGHYYCRPCFVSFVEGYLKDETLHPLRCCKIEVSLDNLSTFLSDKAALRRDFYEKRREYEIPAKDRVYCSNPRCSTFLGSAEPHDGVIDDRIGLVCYACETETCPRCKEEGHLRAGDCAVNKDVEALKSLATRQGWQTCPGCGNIVELHHGCNHMTCHCRTQFCYVCAVPWKDCECPQWDEDRLLITARQRVENDIGVDAVRQTLPAMLAEIVRDRAQDLRYNHGECAPHMWHYRFGAARCEHCFWDAPRFIYVSAPLTTIRGGARLIDVAEPTGLFFVFNVGLPPLQQEQVVIELGSARKNFPEGA